MIAGIRTTVILTIWLAYLASSGFAQSSKELTLEECYQLARENYPLIKQKELISKTKEYSLENISKGYLPQFNIGGQASYQSAVTQLPFQVPGMHIEPLSKKQYKIYGEVDQTLFDGGVIRQQHRLQENSSQIEDQQVEVELYKLQDRINQLYFGILLIDEQTKQLLLVRKDLEIAIQQAEARILNGTALQSTADILKAELLKTEQQQIELNANRKALLDMLSLFIAMELDENTILQKPQTVVTSETINRPELTLFTQQQRSFDIRKDMIRARNLPKLGFFFQGGYGRPALNLLKNQFDFYYIGGFRLNWSLSGYYTSNKERQILEANKSMLNVQKEVFLFNTNLALKQQSAETQKLQALTRSDEEIINLRTKIKNTAKAQFDNGVITSNDYLKEINAEDQARQKLLLHEIQLLLAEYSIKTTSGN